MFCRCNCGLLPKKYTGALIIESFLMWPISQAPVRFAHKPHERSKIWDLYRRRIDQGPEPDRPRSAFVNWNYNSEIFAFGKRLGENFKDHTIKTAFIHSSYTSKELEQRKALEVATDVLPLEDNRKLAKKGEEVMTTFIRAFLRKHHPTLPEECIGSVCRHLTSTETLLHIASNMGIKDLVLCSEFPVPADVLCETMKAIIGAIAADEGLAKSERFVQDFLLTQLIGKDMNEYLGISNPMGLLAGILQDQGKSPPEPRLIFESGSETILSVFMVGIYVDKELIGKSFGETAMIAEEMAARDALRNYFGTCLHQACYNFDIFHNVDSYKDVANVSVDYYLKQKDMEASLVP